jgi:hypothetical protein
VLASALRLRTIVPDLHVFAEEAYVDSRLFAPLGVNWIQRLPRRPDLTHDFNSRRTIPPLVDGDFVLSTCYVFDIEGPNAIRSTHDVVQWMPRPAEDILREARQFVTGLPTPLVGVHVRNSTSAVDNTPVGLYGPVLHKVAPDAYFYATSDDPSSLDRLREELGSERVFSREKILSRRTIAGEREAMLDIAILSICSFVVGSDYSSFSRLATILNGSKSCLLIGLAERGMQR